MQRRSSLLVVALLAVLVSSGWLWFKVVGAGADMTAAGEKFLASLTAEQRKTAQMGYDDPARLDWHFIPKASRKGLQIKEMSPEQRKAAHALLSSALSQAGYEKATTIMEPGKEEAGRQHSRHRALLLHRVWPAEPGREVGVERRGTSPVAQLRRQ
jgi:hypothetical protein